MNLFSTNKISKFMGEKELIRNLSFGLNLGEKLGIIGVNGSGKSTLLKVLSSEEDVDSGEVYKNRELKISTLFQNPNLPLENTISQFFQKNPNEKMKLIFKYLDLCEDMETGKDVSDEFDTISSEIEKQNAWMEEDKIKSILKELGINDLHLKLSELSGGMQKKVCLVNLLISDSNLIILDEPTNHLDINTIIWLENYLINTEKSVLLITHDRYFLERITNRILEIAIPDCIIYEGNYEYYLEKKALLEESKERTEAKKERFLKIELDWLRRQPKARTTKQKAREDRFYDVEDREKFIKQEKIELKTGESRQGKKILEAINLSKKFGEKILFQKFDYVFKQKERIGIIGPNGAGKSTLLNILLGKIESDTGNLQVGVNTKFGYFDQTSKDMNPEFRVLEYIQKTTGEYIKTETGDKISAGSMLERFQFPSKMQSQLISKLSGGEKRRLYLVQILMQNPNFLVLDEPTNDFDIRTLGILEEFILEFSGTVIIVSHDRYFMDRLCNQLICFDGKGNLDFFTGQYSEYLEKEKSKPKEKKIIQEPEKILQEKTNPKKDKELKKLEEKISELETKKQNLEKQISETSENYSKLQELNSEIQKIDSDLEKKIVEWENLSK